MESRIHNDTSNVRICTRCLRDNTNSRYQSCDSCRDYHRARRQVQRESQPVSEPQERTRTQRLPAAYISQLSKMKPLDIGTMNIICSDCGAKHWIDELPSNASKSNMFWTNCCNKGLVKPALLKQPPDYLKDLLTNDDPQSKAFRASIRQYNAAFAFTSMKFDDRNIDTPSGWMPFQIHGESYHLQGPLTPNEGSIGSYSQIYIYDPDYASGIRSRQNSNLDRDIFDKLTLLLLNHNPHVTLYRSAYEMLKSMESQGNDDMHVVITPKIDIQLVEGRDRRTQNLPTSDEVAAIIPDSSYQSDIRDIHIYLKHRPGSFQRISQNHALYMPLHYVLLFPKGDLGWCWELRLNNNSEKRLEQRQYYRFRLHMRDSEYPIIFLSQRLFQQYIVDAWAICEQNKLDWLKSNQSDIRADLYNGLTDAVINDDTDPASVGTRFVLPSSHLGSPRFMANQYQDAMAIVRHFGKPSLFITFTASPRWDEITNELLPGQHASDRPDLIARVFDIKIKKFIKDIKKKNIFGKYRGLVRTIEYQKRGLPHQHLLLFLDPDDKIDNKEKIDEVICATIPSKEDEPELFEIVTRNMVHGPCGKINPKSPCMIKDKFGNMVCSKNYPKKLSEETMVPEDGYPAYRRTAHLPPSSLYSIPHPTRRNERFHITNEWVVPYNPYLTKKYKAHINVECCGSVQAIKYINKYIYKGQDRTTLRLSDSKDEIEKYLQGRYIGPSEAIWRLFEFKIHEEDPTIITLPVHLPDQQPVCFNPNASREEIQRKLDASKSKLMAWFEYNATNAHEDFYVAYSYGIFPQHFVFDTPTKKWMPRKHGFALGRMHYCTPTSGERYYLRLLLTVSEGAKSFKDLRTVRNTTYDTFQEACVALNLVEDDQEWVKCFDEAVVFSSGHGLRSLFVTALMYGGILKPKDLWDQFCGAICDDLQHKLDHLFPDREYISDAAENQDDSNDQTFYENSPVLDYGLYLLQVELENLNKSLSAFRMPSNKFDWAQRIEQQHADNAITSNAFLRMEYSHDANAEENLYTERYNSFNVDQKKAFDTIVSSVEDDESPMSFFFLQGPAGTGKTFVYNTLCNYFRSKRMIVACVASSGIASLLLPNGRTSHFLFKIPLLIASDSTCSIKKNSELAEYLRRVDLIIWDEVPMQNKYCFEAVDRALKDIRSSDKMFGGAPVVLGGDFAQIPPVVRNGDRPQIVDASIRNSYLWSKCQVLRLSKNMRVQGSHFNDELYKTWLSQLPYNPFFQNKDVNIPAYIYRTNELNDLIERVYPIDQLSNPDTYPALFGSSSILSSRNTTVDDINKIILNKMPGEQFTSFSVDKADVSNSNDTDAPNELFQVTTEYLQSLNPPNFPRSKLQLKIGSVVMLLRNLNVQAGLCNGTRLLVREIGAYTLQVSIINSADPEDINIIHCIPRITLSTLEGELPFTLTRKQFPVRLCFAMTINKSQGQSLNRVGIDLRYPTFTHGQLYVAFSRSKNWQKVSVLLAEDNRTQKTENIVYPELLL